MELTDKLLKRFETQRKKLFYNATLRNSMPKLNTLHYTDSGHLELTNSYAAIRLYDCHDGKEKKVPHIEGTYPDLDRIFAGKEGKQTVELDTKRMENILHPFVKLEDKGAILNFTKSGVYIKSIHITKEAPIELAHSKLELDIKTPHYVGVNTKYLHDCFNFFSLEKIKTVTMYYGSSLRPMHFTYENLDYIVTPIRATQELEIKND